MMTPPKSGRVVIPTDSNDVMFYQRAPEGTIIMFCKPCLQVFWIPPQKGE